MISLRFDLEPSGPGEFPVPFTDQEAMHVYMALGEALRTPGLPKDQRKALRTVRRRLLDLASRREG